MIANGIQYIGVDDKELDLFESQYIVPHGMAYNSYVIFDEKIVVMDTVDARASTQWLENLRSALAGKTPDYLVISHMEPDHAGTIGELVDAYPNITLVGNGKTFSMLPNFFQLDGVNTLTVKEGDTLSLGQHTLQFLLAPMVHWPEVMVTYEQSTKTLFSADAFGKFGTLDTEEDWACEARRYYFNIVGKYGMQVQSLLKKVAALEVYTICPLHGPVLKEDLGFYIGKYQIWSSYQPEDKGVLVAYASIHGHTAQAAQQFAEDLRQMGVEHVATTDLTREDLAEAVEDAFRYDRLVLAASSYDAGVFPPMEHFLLKLKAKNFQNRTVALIENGSWGPTAAKTMKGYLEGMKNLTILEPVVTIRSALNEDSSAKLHQLAETVKNS
jgi:flavorubredoxin